MVLTDQVADSWARAQGWSPNEATRDAYYATHIQDIQIRSADGKITTLGEDGDSLEPGLHQDAQKPRTPEEQAAYEHNTGEGKILLEEAIADHKDKKHAFLRTEIGWIDILWGRPGNPKRDFENGSGLSHIITKRKSEGYDGEKFARDIYVIIAEGTIGNEYRVKNHQRRNITLGKSTVVIQLESNKLPNGDVVNDWVVTGFTRDKKYLRGATGLGQIKTGATDTMPTYKSRHSTGAGDESNIARVDKDGNPLKQSDLKGQVIFNIEDGRGLITIFEGGDIQRWCTSWGMCSGAI